MNWNFLFSNKSVHVQANIFNQTLMNVLSTYIPNKLTAWQRPTKIPHECVKVLRKKLWSKSMHVNLSMLIKKTIMLTWNSRLYQQKCQKWYWKENDDISIRLLKICDFQWFPQNYWSISLFPIFGKIFERISFQSYLWISQRK